MITEHPVAASVLILLVASVMIYGLLGDWK